MADSNRTGSFLLSDVRQRSLDGYWETVQTNAQFGWAAGGFPALNSVNRIDFANDTVNSSSRGNLLTVAREQLAGVSNSSYGWFIGGLTPAPAAISLVDRIDFSNDLAVANTRGPITTTTYGGSAVGNQYFGWHAGGLTPTITSTVTRIAWASDSPTAASVRGPLNQTSYAQAAVSNNVYGWWAGGYVPAATTVVGRIDFSNDSPTAATVRGPLSLVRTQLAGAANANYGWFGGGVNPSPFYIASIVDRVDFSNDTLVTVVRGNLSTTKRALAATGNQNYGWFTGGYNLPGSPGYKSTVDRIDYSNDSPASASPRGLIATRSSHAAVAGIANLPKYPTQGMNTNQSTAGYGWIAGGSSGFTQVNRIDFANDSPTTASVRGSLGSNPRPYMGATGNANYGWFAGGTSSPSAQNESLVTRIDYSNDSPTSGSPRGFLSVARQQLGATGNANYGWWGGGAISSAPLVPTSYVDRIDFANDSPTNASPRGPLSSARYATAATGNANYGWWTGGWSTSQLERIDFSNDSPAASSVRGLQSVLRGGQAATSNSNYGWFGGGLISLIPGSARSIVDRIDFANDSPASASPRGPLSDARTQLAAVGNANYGWFSGGGYNIPSQSSTVDRIDFANDSPTAASPRGPLGRGDTGLSGTSNYVRPSLGQQTVSQPLYGQETGTYGWWGGGALGPGFSSTVDRIDFSNDSPTGASARGPLLSVRQSHAAAGNANYAWHAGGDSGAGVYSITTIERIDYSNDSPTATARRNVLLLPVNIAATGNSNYGWYVGGVDATTPTSNVFSSTSRLDYANDTSTASPRGILTQGRTYLYGISNDRYGWFAGGLNPNTSAIISTIDRIDFSNDLATATARGPLTAIRTATIGVGNANYGWFAGGANPSSTFTSVVDRIDYSNDSPTSASPRGPLSLARGYGGGASNSNYGWIAGGVITGFPFNLSTSLVDRIDFSNDSPTVTSPRGQLSQARSQMASTSNYVKSPPQANITNYNIGSATAGTGAGTFGWFVGGGPTYVTSVNRIDFSNDSPTSASPRGAITTARSQFVGSSGNANYGWFGGGYTFSPPVTATLYTTVERIDYANDSATALARAAMATASARGSGVGNGNFGWWNGGGPSATSTIYRINYNNDVASPLTRGSISFTNQYKGAVSAKNYGYWTGGFVPTSVVTRIDFSNDDVITVDRGPTLLAKENIMGLSNSAFGWWCGGNTNGPNISNIDRMDFSNDLVTMSARANLPTAFSGGGSAGNQLYGWLNNSATVYRIDYNNDLVAASTRGGFLLSMTNNGATSNYVR